MEEKNSITIMEERDEEAEETLSFCDLPLNSTDSDLSLQSYPYSSDDTFFEFSVSHNLSDHSPEKNFQFFQKSIPEKTEKINKLDPYPDNWAKRVYRKTGSVRDFFVSDNLSDQQDQNCHFLKHSISQKPGKNTKTISYSDNWAKRVYGNNTGLYELSVSDDLSDQQDQNCHFLKHSISQKPGKNSKSTPELDNWAKRVYGETNVLLRRGTAAPANARWPLLMFGPPKTPTSRRGSGGVSERKVKREKKMWGVIKALGCGGTHLAVA